MGWCAAAACSLPAASGGRSKSFRISDFGFAEDQANFSHGMLRSGRLLTFGRVERPLKMTDCLFCRIIGGEIPSKKVYEDERVYAFEDIAPKAPTHVLVVPKKHIAKLADLAREDAPLVGEVASRAAEIARERGLADYRLVCNNGAGVGQSVFHLHFHLLGGRPMSWPPG